MDNASSSMLRHYLDRETGELLLTSEDDLEDLAEDAARIEAEPERYLEFPPIESRLAYRDMEEFVETVTDARFQQRLWRALDGPRPFRRFKDAIADEPAVEERWFRVRDERQVAHAISWLAEEGIAPASADGNGQ
jgi:hypothetical protein